MPKDPKEKFGKPPFPPQRQEKFPGREHEMDPEPNYGKGEYKGSGRLEGKVALITGGDSGIGRAVAYAYAVEGADIALSYLEENTDAEQTKKDIEEVGKKCLLLEGDVSEEDHCKKIIEKTVKEFGRLDILVNNAAHQFETDSIQDVTGEMLKKIYSINVFSIFYLCKAAIKFMKEGGSIINTSSVQAYSPAQRILTYASTKGAVSNFTKGFAQEAIQKGIRVNGVAPGPVWTPFIPASSLDPQSVSHFGEGSLLKRPAQPAELAPVFVFLASDEASYVVGEVYGVTGSIKKP